MSMFDDNGSPDAPGISDLERIGRLNARAEQQQAEWKAQHGTSRGGSTYDDPNRRVSRAVMEDLLRFRTLVIWPVVFAIFHYTGLWGELAKPMAPANAGIAGGVLILAGIALNSGTAIKWMFKWVLLGAAVIGILLVFMALYMKPNPPVKHSQQPSQAHTHHKAAKPGQ